MCPRSHLCGTAVPPPPSDDALGVRAIPSCTGTSLSSSIHHPAISALLLPLTLGPRDLEILGILKGSHMFLALERWGGGSVAHLSSLGLA